MELYPDTSYDSIDNLPYFNFVEILKTADLKYLGSHENPVEVWMDIQNEYCKAANVDNFDIKQQAKILSLERKHNYIEGCLEILRASYLLKSVEGFDENFKAAGAVLNGFGYIIDHKKPFEEDFERLLNQVGGLKMKITIEKAKIQKEKKKKGISLWKELVNLERAVPNVKIDPYKDPVAKVIEIQLVAKQIVDEQRSNRLNNRR